MYVFFNYLLYTIFHVLCNFELHYSIVIDSVVAAAAAAVHTNTHTPSCVWRSFYAGAPSVALTHAQSHVRYSTPIKHSVAAACLTLQQSPPKIACIELATQQTCIDLTTHMVGSCLQNQNWIIVGVTVVWQEEKSLRQVVASIYVTDASGSSCGCLPHKYQQPMWHL